MQFASCMVHGVARSIITQPLLFLPCYNFCGLNLLHNQLANCNTRHEHHCGQLVIGQKKPQLSFAWFEIVPSSEHSCHSPALSNTVRAIMVYVTTPTNIPTELIWYTSVARLPYFSWIFSVWCLATPQRPVTSN